MKRYKVNLIILNYEGEELLRKYLDSVVQAAKASSHDCTVMVLDNCSTDGSVSFLQKNYPDVAIIRAKENKVLCSYNDVVKNLQDDIVILLNNDLKVDLNFIDPLVSVFDRYPDAFFVSSYRDRSIAQIRWGVLTADITFPGYEAVLNQFGYTLTTGVGAFDRRRFVELGGYDELYLPGRYEDLDLCFRGWKRGWKGYYQPKSKWEHEGATSFKKRYSEKEIERLVLRNSILFMIKNIEPWRLALFFVFLVLRLVRFLLLGKGHMIQGFFDAIQKLPHVLHARYETKQTFSLSDSEVFRTVNEMVIV